ncbi:MAG TPA: single-stranded DNA-binding protein [Bryobacteraceae bacterium]|jgi:single-strand DNA-binding protein
MNNTKNNNPKEPTAAPMYQNQVRLVGFLGDKPVQYENRALFSLATKTSWQAKDSQQWEHHTEWHRCVAWGDLAKAIRPLAKGDHIVVDGEIRSSSYDKELPVVGGGTTIVPMRAWEIRVRSVRKLERKAPAAKAKAEAKPKVKPPMKKAA